MLSQNLSYVLLQDPGNLGTLIRTATAFAWVGMKFLIQVLSLFSDRFRFVERMEYSYSKDVATRLTKKPCAPLEVRRIEFQFSLEAGMFCFLFRNSTVSL